MSADPLTPYGNKPMVTPIVNAVNYQYCSFDVLRQITDGQIDGYTYHRDDNPTVRAVEKKIAAMEGAEDCILCTSGMAACIMVYLTYLSAGDHLILFHDIYGAHYKLSLILERLGIDITWIHVSQAPVIQNFIKPNTRMIFCETPSNPLCKIIDIRALKNEAKMVGALLVVDNTFATPYHQKPLSLGADIVVHSATKALGGHNDLMAGAIAGSRTEYDRLWFTRQAMGTTLDAYSGSLLERGLKTFDIRAEKMASNAMAIAEYLSQHSKISRVYYPGLMIDQGNSVALRQMENGFGGVLAFDVGNTQEDAKKFISELKSIFHAVSLGSTESLVCIPYLTTLLYMPEERRIVFGVRENTVRLSAGIEKTDLLINDIEQSLNKLMITEEKKTLQPFEYA
ncbi:MAG: aminotransferase class I/II-fold pyridoxal phosphate-dependent enzyme [Candidatus Auribacterota bacterium]|jgi:cystathionine beta-lyase/cystathionine gamma-synthase|nr:aminotransferase class I/II-fold pyridoxal phosphate-dependent enzyme [Candidatus Auribacterota bacterium]